jgi:hypothetical protein
VAEVFTQESVVNLRGLMLLTLAANASLADAVIATLVMLLSYYLLADFKYHPIVMYE